MAGTRTAGTVDGTPLYKDVSLHWIDIAGALRSDSYQCAVGATNANIEAFAVGMQAGSASSLWKVVVGDAYSSTPLATNASNASHESADDVINLLLKTAANAAQDVVIRSPLQTLFVGDTKEVDVTDGLLATIKSTAIAILDGTYLGVSWRFTERHKSGKRQRI